MVGGFGIQSSSINVYKYRFVILYYITATGLMLYLHTKGWSWDFNAYTLSGEYLLHNGVYMEWLRPPLVPILLGIFQFIFSPRTSQFLFVVFSNTILLIGCVHLAKQYDINPTILYTLVLSPYIIFVGTLAGSELLYLAIVTLYLADFKSYRAGIWMGLAFLTRYSGVILIPLIIFQREKKILFIDRKVVITLLVALGTVLPWFVYNFIALGHPFASVASNYALVEAERATTTVFDPLNLTIIAGPGLLFAILYLLDKNYDSEDVLFASLAILTIIRQIDIDLKETRYLIEIVAVTGYFGAKNWTSLRYGTADFVWENWLEKRKNTSQSLIQTIAKFKPTAKKYISREAIMVQVFALLFIVQLLIGGSLIVGQSMTNPDPYLNASDEVGSCRSVSNGWVHLSFAGTPAGPPSFESHSYFRERGYMVVTFSGSSYNITGDGCMSGPYDMTYIETLGRAYGETPRYCSYTPIDSCGIEDAVADAWNKIGG